MLILVRHAQPVVDPDRPSSEWRLSEDGRSRSRELAETLRTYHPGVVVTSVEPKAAETGRIIAETLGLPCETADNLHEHQRTGEYFSQEEFQQKIRNFFERPDELVFGLETAEQALERFQTAVSQTLTRHPNQNIIIAAHGTVITLFAAAHNPDIAPIPFWQQLQMPDFVVLMQPRLKLCYSGRCRSHPSLV